MSINIDLRNLTPDMLAECRPFAGSADYAAPCVIGVLMNPADRSRVAKKADTTSNDSVASFVGQGIITVPEDQLDDVKAIQLAFDRKKWFEVSEIASKYMTSTEDQNK